MVVGLLNIDHCHPNLSIYELLTSTNDEYESGFVRNQGNRDCQIKGDHVDAERGHMFMMIKMRDLFGFEKDLDKNYIWFRIQITVKKKEQ